MSEINSQLPRKEEQRGWMSENRLLSTHNTGYTVINSSKTNLVMVQYTAAFKSR